MRVTPTGQSEYHDGNEVLRYGRDISENETYAVWYHDGLRKYDEAAWAMATDVEWLISVSVDTILVACDEGLYAIERSTFTESVEEIDGTEQLVARASDEFVRKVGDDPDDYLRGELWLTAENSHGGYHKDKNHA